MICRIAGEKTPSTKKKVRRPANPNHDKQSFSKAPPLVEKRCSRCLLVIQRGKSKKLERFHSKNSEVKQIASSVIKNKIPSPGSTVNLQPLCSRCS